MNNKVLNPEEFTEFLVPDDLKEEANLDMNKIIGMIPDLFEKILHSDDVDDFCSDKTYDLDNVICSPMLVAKTNHCSVEPLDDMQNMLGDVLGGVADLQPEHKTVIISISQPENCPEEVIAKDYINYLLSSAKDFSPEELTMTLLNNFV